MLLNAIWSVILVDNKPPTPLPSYIHFWTKTPFIPPLQALLLWQSLSLFWLCGLVSARYPLIGTCSALGILFVDARLKQKKNTIVAILLFAMGFLVLHLVVPPRPPYPVWALEEKSPKFIRLEGTVSKVESLTNRRLRIFLHNTHSVEYPKHILPGTVIWTWEAEKLKPDYELSLIQRPLPGQRVQISARVRSTEGFKNWGSNDFGFYWQTQNVFWRIWSRGDFGNPQIIGEANALANIRQNLLHNLEDNLFTRELDPNSIKAQAFAFLPALLFGEKYFINHDTMENMRAASLVHSLALSGQHLAIVGLCAALLVGFMCMLYPKLLLILPYRKWLGFFALPLAILYLWVGNAPPSLIRAALMLALALLFYWRAKLATLMDVLLLTFLLITFYDPTAIFNLGLQLSVLCVASIALVVPLISRIPKIHPAYRNHQPIRFFIAKFGRSILQIFIISFSIQLMLAPVFIYYFPPAGPWFISNIVWLPVLGLWVLPLAVLGTIVMQLETSGLSQQILHLAAWPAEILLQILQFMRVQGLFDFSIFLRPHWSVYLAWATLGVGLSLVVGRISFKDFLYKTNLNSLKTPVHKTLLMLAMILILFGPILRYAEYWLLDVNIEMLDVGQGQAICITSHGGQRILVDGGGSMSKYFDTGAHLVIPSLTYNKPPRLLAVVATHPDMDHFRGLLAVLEHIQVNTFYHNGKKMSQYHANKLDTLKLKNKMPPTEIMYRGMTVPIPSIDNSLRLEVLNPPKKNRFSSNNASIVLHLVQNKNNIKQGIALLGGDAEIYAQQNILNFSKDISASVFVLPHHGSQDALWQPFYDAVDAQLALVSSGNYNKFSFPHEAVKKALQKYKIPIYNTAKSGAISVNLRNKTKQNFEQKDKAILSVKMRKSSSGLVFPQIYSYAKMLQYGENK